MSVIDSTNPGGGRSSGDHRIWMGTSVPCGASPKASQSRKAEAIKSAPPMSASTIRRPPHHRSSPSRPRTGLSPFCSHVRSRCLVLRRSERYACPASILGGLGIMPGHWAHGKRRRTAIPRSDTHLATHVSPASSEQRSWNTSASPQAGGYVPHDSRLPMKRLRHFPQGSVKPTTEQRPSSVDRHLTA